MWALQLTGKMVKQILIFAIFGLGTVWVNAQTLKDLHSVMDLIPQRNLGPAAMSGRITSLAMPRYGALQAINRNIIYAGTASGGVWKSVNGGVSWSPIFDDMDVQSIGAVSVDPQNPSVVWVGTGEGNPRNSHNSGKGIYRSSDAGKTWKCMGLESTKTIHRIVINPLNPHQLWAAAMGSVWGGNEERGVYRSNDDGETWTKILFVNNTTGCAELIIDPLNPLKLYAAMYDFQRFPWTYRSGGPGSGLYITHDGGKTWKRSSNKEGLPKGELGRIGLAVSASQPNRVYALVEATETGMYRSDDGGEHWNQVSTEANAGNRPFYYSEIYVHPRNENRVYSIWSQISCSQDGGKHWEILADWGHIHPDHHAFFIHPDDPDYIINGNDGGLNISLDGGKTWRYAENIPVGQFYHVDIDNEIPYNVYGGLQDNGSWVGPAYHFIEGGIRNHEWQEVLFGDGFDVAPMPNRPDEGYAMFQGGNLYHWNLRERTSEFIKPQHPEGRPLRFNWNAALALDPFNPTGLFYGSQYLHYSGNIGQSWEIMSGDLTSNNPKKMEQAKSGGLTVDATGAENHCTILAIAPSPAVRDVIWVSTDDGNVMLTKTGGRSWENVGLNIVGKPEGAWVPYLWVNPRTDDQQNAGECWVVINNYRQNDWMPYLYRTTDYGKTWNRMVTANGLGFGAAAKSDKTAVNKPKNKEVNNNGGGSQMGDPITGYILSVLPDAQHPNLVFLGTDHGLWVSINAGAIWHKWKKFPSVPVVDMKIHSREKDLVLGTFGRGLWVFDNIGLLRKLADTMAVFTSTSSLTAQNNTSVFQKSFEILNSTDGVLVRQKQPSGARFSADEAWVAPNKAYGAQLDLFVVAKKDEKTKDWKSVSCTGRVYDASGNLIRTHKFTFDSTGLYRISWRMVQDGFRWPSHQTPKLDDDLPSGRTVIPGRYKLVIKTIDGATDSVFVNVITPPNLPFNPGGMDRRNQLIDTLKITVERARLTFEAIKDAQKSIDLALVAKYVNDSALSRLKKLEKPLKDSVDQLKLLYMLPADYRPYEEATIRLMDHLGAANELIESSEMPGNNCEIALKTAQIETDKVVRRINHWLMNQYQLFLDEVAKETVAPISKPKIY